MAEGDLLKPISLAEPHGAAAPELAPEPVPTTPQALTKDGKVYTFSPEEYAQARGAGWRTEQEHADSLAVDADEKHKARVEAYGKDAEEHQARTHFLQFGNEMLFGVPELVLQKQMEHGTPAERERIASYLEAQEEFEKNHEGASIASKAGGFLASLAMTDGASALGDAAEHVVIKTAGKSVLGKAAANAARLGTEAAVLSSPRAAIQASYGDVHEAAETVLWGTSIGLAMGGAGSLLNSGAKAAIGKVAGKASESSLASIAKSQIQKQGLKALGVTEDRAAGLGPEQGAKLVDIADREGILSAAPEKQGAMVSALRKDAGDSVAEHHTAFDDLIAKDAKLKGMGPSATTAADTLETEVREKLPDLKLEMNRSEERYWQKIDRDMRRVGEEPSFRNVQMLQDRIGQDVSKFAPDTLKGKIASMADSVLKKHLDESAAALFKAGGKTEEMADYLTQKERLWAAKELQRNPGMFEKLLEKSGQAPAGMPGMGTMAGMGLGMVTGHAPIVALPVAGKMLLNSFTENRFGLLGKSVSFLRKYASDPAAVPLIGGLMAKEGAAALKTHIADLPEVLVGNKLIEHTSHDVVKSIIGETRGLSNEQQYDKLTATITQAAADPSSTASRVGDLASTFSGTDVNLANVVAEKKLAAISYLQAQIPKNPNPDKPFQENDWKPTETQRREFLAKVSVVSNPMVAWEHYQKGELTPADRDALIAVYPSIYKRMVEKIQEAAYDPNGPKLSSAKRAQIDMFTGGMLGTQKNLGAIQQVFAQNQQQSQQQAMGPKPSSRPKLKGPNLQTDAQRIGGGQSR